MSSGKSFFKFSMDETSLHDFFSTAEERFRKYDTMIAAQNSKIDSLSVKLESTKTQLEKQSPVLSKRIDELVPQIADIGKEFEKYEQRISEFEQKLGDMQQHVATFANMESELKQVLKMQLDSASQSLVSSIDNVAARVNDAEARISALESENKRLNEDLARLKTESARLTKDVECHTEELKATSERVSSIEVAHAQQFSGVDKNLESLKAEVAALKEKVKNPFPVRPPEPDLSLIEMHDVESFPVTGPAALPKLVRIRKVDDLVRYVYDFVPTLQGILDWSFAQLDRLNTAHSVLSDDVSNNLSQTHDTILDVQNTMRAMHQTFATREEVILLMKRKHAQSGESYGSGARCISCGRELPDEFDYSMQGQRRIGTAAPPSVSGSTKRMVVGLVENPPRSARGYKPRARKIQIPK